MGEPAEVGAVAAGAALGGVVRFVLTQLVVAQVGGVFAFLATFGINVTGSFLIGVVLEVARSRTGLDPLWRLFLATGILGGYTTFSTFSYEAFALWTGGRTAMAAAYVAGTVALGVAGAAGGIGLARLLLER